VEMPCSAQTSQKLGVSHNWVFCTALRRFSVPLSRTGPFGGGKDASPARDAPEARRAAIGTRTGDHRALSADLPHQAACSHPQRDEGRGVELRQVIRCLEHQPGVAGRTLDRGANPRLARSDHLIAPPSLTPDPCNSTSAKTREGRTYTNSASLVRPRVNP